MSVENRFLSPVMTTREAAERLGISTKTVVDLIYAEGLPAVRIRRQWRIPRAEFESWVSVRKNDIPQE